jgi:hypothetical protein
MRWCWEICRKNGGALQHRQVWGGSVHNKADKATSWCEALHSAAPPSAAISACQRAWQALTEESPMTMFVFAALTVTAVIWAITAPQSPQDLTMDEISQLIVSGFVP